jgi:HD-GYP domain-containing protein (c-di-GMP phosphodiesterase class II)
LEAQPAAFTASVRRTGLRESIHSDCKAVLSWPGPGTNVTSHGARKNAGNRLFFCYISPSDYLDRPDCAFATEGPGRSRASHSLTKRSTSAAMSVATTSPVSPAHRVLPSVLYFAKDDIGHRMLGSSQRFRRIPFEDLEQDLSIGAYVLLTSSEALLGQHYTRLRLPNVRIVGIAESRFHDARVDGAVYAYLPPQTPAGLVERMIDNALDHIHLAATRRDVHEKLLGATREIRDLNQIGAALSAEREVEHLLELILTKSREITRSDAGSLYLVETVPAPKKPAALQSAAEDAPLAIADGTEEQGEEPRKQLRFKLAQNDSIKVPFRESTMDISPKSIAGYVALSGEVVNLEDAYRLPEGVPYKINRKFDEDSGYRTKSILAVPMKNQKGEILGVVQLINAKRDPQAKLDSLSAVANQVVPYTFRQQELTASLASQAAVALENTRLYSAIQAMLEGFVKASVTAIEARDPTTSGHSFRVSNLTVALAEAVDRADSGPFAEINFSRNQMKEIRYAALLHDFGKVGVREEVLVKAKKLYPSQLELVRQRFQLVKRTVEAGTLRHKLDYLMEKGREQYLAKLPEFDREYQEHIKELDEFLAIVLRADEPSVLPEGHFEQLLDIAATHFMDFEGNEQPLLSMDEIRLLSIRKGSLDDSERLQIESHVVHTFNFLSQIPWTKEIKGIPLIARGHHEKLNGKGYPYKLSAPQIPVQTRMMTISDIFDALSAADRPYKRAVPEEKALEILGYSVKDGELDPELFKVFIEARVFQRWKIEPYPY